LALKEERKRWRPTVEGKGKRKGLPYEEGGRVQMGLSRQRQKESVDGEKEPPRKAIGRKKRKEERKRPTFWGRKKGDTSYGLSMGGERHWSSCGKKNTLCRLGEKRGEERCDLTQIKRVQPMKRRGFVAEKTAYCWETPDDPQNGWGGGGHYTRKGGEPQKPKKKKKQQRLAPVWESEEKKGPFHDTLSQGRRKEGEGRTATTSPGPQEGRKGGKWGQSCLTRRKEKEGGVRHMAFLPKREKGRTF